MPGGRIEFGRAAATRIKNAVIRIESMPYPSSNERSPWPVGGGGSVLQYSEGVVTNSITAANTNSYGKGMVQMVQPQVNANTNAAVPVNSGSPVICYNWSANSGTVNTNTHVGMIQRNNVNGSLVWELLWRDC